MLWPALLTLGVTLVRLLGERLGWSPFLFSRLPGGGLSPLGITWLAPLVGIPTDFAAVYIDLTANAIVGVSENTIRLNVF